MHIEETLVDEWTDGVDTFQLYKKKANGETYYSFMRKGDVKRAVGGKSFEAVAKRLDAVVNASWERGF